MCSSGWPLWDNLEREKREKAVPGFSSTPQATEFLLPFSLEKRNRMGLLWGRDLSAPVSCHHYSAPIQLGSARREREEKPKAARNMRFQHSLGHTGAPSSGSLAGTRGSLLDLCCLCSLPSSGPASRLVKAGRLTRQKWETQSRYGT